MSSQPRELVFISYSRKDRMWLDRVRPYLEPFDGQGKLSFWTDRYIKVGDQWKRNIIDALDRTAIGIVLVSPNYLSSDFIRSVELPALCDGASREVLTLFCIPISSCRYDVTCLAAYQWGRNPAKPLDLLPLRLRNRALVQISRKFEAVVNHYVESNTSAPRTVPRGERLRGEAVAATETGQPGKLYGVPSLPPHYLPRTGDLARLRQALVGSESLAVGITGSAERIGLHGQGGIGKSVLAAALASDEEVRRVFPDGVYWLTLGQAPDLLHLQAELGSVVSSQPLDITSGTEGGKIPPESESMLHAGQRMLREFLRSRSCLLVLDDVWNLEHARALNVVGPRSRLLVTTRDAAVITALGATEVPIKRLSPALALELLATWAGQSKEDLPGVAEAVAAECGYLPLALSLAGARVHDGLSWSDLHHALRLGRMEFLDHPHGSVFRTMRLSLDALPPEQQDRYLELAVFPEGARISEGAVQKLWRHTAQLDAFASKDLLMRFLSKALLERTSGPDGWEFSLHDLQHDFVRILVDDLTGLNRVLLDAFAADLPESSGRNIAWHAMPEGEKYLWMHLGEHLMAADRSEEFEALLLDYRWLEAKLGVLGLPALLSDFEAFPHDGDLALVAMTLRMSAHVLAASPDELPSQLLGRLLSVDHAPIRALTGSVRPLRNPVWLRPLEGSLFAPMGGLRRTLTGHSGAVYSAAVTPDGTRAVSGSADHSLRVWELESGRGLYLLHGHTDLIRSVAVTADGRRAVSGSADHTLKVWDLETGRELHTLEGHSSAVGSVAVAANRGRVVSGSSDGVVKVWDLESGRDLRTLEGHREPVRSVAVTADGRRAVSGSADTTLRVWDLERGRVLRVLKGPASSINSVAITGDGMHVVAGSSESAITVWDLESGREVRTLLGHMGGIVSVAVTPDGRRVVSGSTDKMLGVWDLESGREICMLRGHSDWVNAVAVTEDGKWAVSGSTDRTLKVWDLESGKEMRPQVGHPRRVNAVAVTADGRVVSGSTDRTLKVWDLERRSELRTLGGHSGRILSLAVTPDGRLAVSGSEDRTLTVWDLERGQGLRRLEGHTGWVYAVAMAADGRRAVSGSTDKTVRVWDVETGRELRSLVGHSSRASSVAVTGDGALAVSGSSDRTLRVWDLETGEELRRLKGHTGWIHAVAATGDGRLAVSGSADSTVRVWDLKRGRELYKLEGHAGWVSAVAVSADGSRAVSGSLDKTLKVWDLEGGAPITFFTADAPIHCCAIAPDRVTIVAGDALGSVHFLRLEGADLAPQA